MADVALTEGLFFTKTGMEKRNVERIVGDALKGCDDGELYLEYCQSESFTFDDGRVKNAAFDTSQGFGLRAVSGEATGYAHATNFSEDAIARAAANVRTVERDVSAAIASSLTPCARSHCVAGVWLTCRALRDMGWGAVGARSLTLEQPPVEGQYRTYWATGPGISPP